MTIPSKAKGDGMSEWQDISTAPKNPEGEGVGPWILIFSEWDHGVYTARWECRAEVRGWKVMGRGAGPWTSPENIRHWMPMPLSPFQQRKASKPVEVSE